MVINPIVGVYIPIIRIPIKKCGMTIPNIATFDHGTTYSLRLFQIQSLLYEFRGHLKSYESTIFFSHETICPDEYCNQAICRFFGWISWWKESNKLSCQLPSKKYVRKEPDNIDGDSKFVSFCRWTMARPWGASTTVMPQAVNTKGRWHLDETLHIKLPLTLRIDNLWHFWQWLSDELKMLKATLHLMWRVALFEWRIRQNEWIRVVQKKAWTQLSNEKNLVGWVI